MHTKIDASALQCMNMIGLYEAIFILYFFGLGVIIGSFLNVVIYRLHTSKSLNDRSHCLSCGTQLVWYELFPVVSYLVLLGRCKSCQSKISSRYLLVELCTGFLFALAYMSVVGFVPLLLVLILLSALVVIFVYDLYHMVIPDEYVFLGSIISIAYALYGAPTMAEFSISIFAGVLASSFFCLLWVVSSGKWMGFGDVKLAFPLGVMVGISGLFSFIVFSFWLGAVISILLITFKWLLKRGQVHLRFFSQHITMKSEIPFAPFMIASFILVYLLGIDVLSLTAHVTALI